MMSVCMYSTERSLAKATATETATRTSKQARATLFLYISLPSQHDYDEKMSNFTFYGVNKL